MKLGEAWVEIHARDAGTAREVRRIAQQAAAGNDIKLDVHVDDQGRLRDAHGRFAAMGREAEQTSRKVGGLARSVRGLHRDSNNLSAALRGLQFPAVATEATLAAAGLRMAAAGTVALTAGLAPAVGLIAGLPGLLAAVGQAGGTLGLAFFGIADAIKAVIQAEEDAGRAAEQAGRQQAAAARAAEAAQDRLRDATQALARARENAADRVQAAERRLRDSQLAARDAQEALNRARAEARQRLVDLRFELERAALDEEDATLGVLEARQRLNDVIRDPRTSELERERAALSLRQQIFTLNEIRRRNRQLQAEAAAAQRAGVEGSREVIDARRRAQRADEDLRDATRDMARAQRDAARMIADASEQVTRTQRDMARAAAEGGVTASAAARKAQQAMDDLPPSARRLVLFLLDLRDEWKQLREAAAEPLLPGIQQAISDSLVLFPVIRRGAAETATVMGQAARESGRLARSPAFQRDFAAIVSTNVEVTRLFAAAGVDAAAAMTGLTAEARPLALWGGRLASEWAAAARRQVEVGRATGRLDDLFESTIDTTEELLGIVGDLGRGLLDILIAAHPAGRLLLSDIRGLTSEFRAWAGSAEGQRAISREMVKMADTGRDLLPLIRDILIALADLTRIASDLGSAIAEFLNQHPQLRELVAELIALHLALTLIGRVLGPARSFASFLALITGRTGGLRNLVHLMYRLAGGTREVGKAARSAAFELGYLAGKAGSLKLPAAFRGAFGAAGIALMAGGSSDVSGRVDPDTGLKLDTDREIYRRLRGKIEQQGMTGLTPEEVRMWHVLNERIRQYQREQEKARQATNAHTQAIRSQRTTLWGLTSAILESIDSQAAYQQAQLNLKEARERVNELEREGKKNSDEYKQALIDLTYAETGLVRARENRRRALDEERKAILSTTDATEQQVQALIDLYRRSGMKLPRDVLVFLESLKTKSEEIRSRNVRLRVYADLLEKVTQGSAANWRIVEGWGGTPVRRAYGGPVFGPGTSTSDSVPALLSRGEHVITDREVRGAGGHHVIEALRTLWRHAPGYATGGPVAPVRFSFPYDRRAAAQVLAGLEEVRQAAHLFAALKAARTLAEGGLLGTGTGRGGWQWQMAVLRAAFPGLPLISGFRPGAVTATGRRSYHAMGRAVDLPPRMDVFNWIRANYGHYTRELIYSPAGNRQLRNGRPHLYSGITRAMHWDHIHWAFADGAYLHARSPKLAVVGDNPRHGEAIFTDPQLQQVIRTAITEAISGAGGGRHVFVFTDAAKRELFRLVEEQAGRRQRLQVTATVGGG